MNKRYVLDFDEISLGDVARVGGKNASLGELFRTLRPLGIQALDGFAITASAYHRLLETDGLDDTLSNVMDGLDPESVESLAQTGKYARAAILGTHLPSELVSQIVSAYRRLCERLGTEPALAVRSSATAEDLPGASFAGQHQTLLNVVGEDALIDAVHQCYASLFTDRAIDYRQRNGFEHLSVALSVGVQPMVRSDLGSAGVIFTLDTESGFRDVVQVTGAYGLGETVVQGTVNPDEWTVFKLTLDHAECPILSHRRGSKETKLVFTKLGQGAVLEQVPPDDRRRFCLTDADVITLAKWAVKIENHYSQSAGREMPMDIEWAKDGLTGQLYILQARPETVHDKARPGVSERFRLEQAHAEAIVSGQAVGERIASGPVKIVKTTEDLTQIQPGDVLVSQSTNPDWEPVMKRVAAIVTDQGGRTAHAAIVSREIGVPCIVGALDATTKLRDGMTVTVVCAEGTTGHVYSGRVPYHVETIDFSQLPETKTKLMLNVGDPSRAFALSSIPNSGVGLARIEFIINEAIGIHPMALARYPKLKDASDRAAIAHRLGDADPRKFFIQRLAEGVAMIAAAFYPKPVIVRTSDFKTNEYAKLLGGAEFEPNEENPMLGFRGASRYYDPRYQDAFALECLALSHVRKEMSLKNVKVMIPFCRTVQEASLVVSKMASHGLVQGEDGLEIYAMCEIPSNALNAEEFLKVFDGYSIGSNDLTQLTLGIDRDASSISALFDERDPAVKALISHAIAAAQKLGKPIGICGQAPSDYPDFAAWLVEHGITSISLNPDSMVKTISAIADVESRLQNSQPAGEPMSARRAQ